MLIHPGVQSVERSDCGSDVDIDAEMPHPAKAGRDVKRDVIVAAPAGEPRPGTVRQLHVDEFLQSALGFVAKPVVVKKDTHVFARLALVVRLSQPRRVFNGHALEVLVLFKRTVERGRVAPLFEHAMNLRIGAGDETRERVRVKPVERLLAALVWELHQIRQCHHRIPRRVRHHLHREALVLQRLRTAGLEQLREPEFFSRRTANRQRQRFRDQNPPRQHREITFLAVGHVAGRADGFVREERGAVGHFDPPRVTA